MRNLNKLYYKILNNEDYLFFLSIIILFIYFIFRLVDSANIMWNFPFDYANDISSHIAKLFFLAKYGYHSVIPNWYAGFDYVLFRTYPPGWYFFSLPLFYLFGNVQIATYVSLILIYLFSLISIFLIGKKLGFSYLRSLMFFLLMFANPISIGYLLRIGKMPELFGWFFAITSFGILLYYKDKKITWHFSFLSLICAAWLLSNLTSFVACLPLFFGFFIARRKKARYYLLLIAIAVFLLTAFWLIPFLLHSFQGASITNTHHSNWLISSGMSMDKITTWLSSLLIFVTFTFYWIKKRKSRKELLFFIPLLILAGLVFTRLVIFIPLFNQLHPDNFNLVFIMVSIYLFLTTKFNYKEKKLVNKILLALVILSTFCSAIYTQPMTEYTEQNIITLDFMQSAEGILMIKGSETAYPRAFYSYGAIYYNTTCLSGWMDEDLPEEKIKEIKNLSLSSISDCEKFLSQIKNLNVSSIIAYDDECKNLAKCNIKLKNNKNGVCLYQA